LSVSLTDTNPGAVLWSGKYESEPKDIFGIQDQITRQVTGVLAVRVTSLELARSAAKPPSSLEAYDLVLRGRDLLHRLVRSGNAEARTLFERAIEMDPSYAPGYIGLGRVNLNSVTQGWTQFPGEALERARSLAQRAIELDNSNAAAHALLGNVAVHFADYDRALDELKRAIDLNGSDAESYSVLVPVLLYRGDIAGAIAAGELVERFQPDAPVSTEFNLGLAYVLGDRAADAVRVLERSIEQNPAHMYSNVMLAAAYALAGRQQEAEHQADRVRQHFPTFPRETFGSALRDFDLRTKLDQALKKAGL
jgi:tetratricopeptide (TPR) repeat protein